MIKKLELFGTLGEDSIFATYKEDEAFKRKQWLLKDFTQAQQSSIDELKAIVLLYLAKSQDLVKYIAQVTPEMHGSYERIRYVYTEDETEKFDFIYIAVLLKGELKTYNEVKEIITLCLNQ